MVGAMRQHTMPKTMVETKVTYTLDIDGNFYIIEHVPAGGSVKRSLAMGWNACETAWAHDVLEDYRNPLETDVLIW